MFCCPNCFKHQELSAYVISASSQKANCDFCETQDIPVIDSREIVDAFIPVVKLYQNDEKGVYSLDEILQKEWDLFNLEEDKIKILLENILKDESWIYPKIFEKNVINITKKSKESEELIAQWNILKEEIKTKNRFFLQNAIDLELLEKYLSDKHRSYFAGDCFYRSRISKETGLPKNELGKPHAVLATAGRANPQGIPYLYLSKEEKTTLYEARASFLDFVTIGTFKLKKDIKVVKLKSVKINSPFEEDIYEKLIYQPFLEILEKDLSKPLRRYDSELDYLPTQYLCEFIKSIGFDGVEFGSAMDSDGTNLAVFDDVMFECIKSKIVEIKNVEIIYGVNVNG